MLSVNMIKKVFLYWVCILLITILLLPITVTAFDQEEGIDAILLIDLSGSMRESDSSRIAIEATKMFIDMLETSNSRVGIIGFNDRLTGVVDISEIHSTADKERLKRIVEAFNYSGWTDIGLSLKSAVEIMTRNMRSTNSPMILMLTDGKVELGPKDRPELESYNDIVEAVSLAGKNLPIYTIGLNYDGTVDRQILQTISDSTGARSYIITEAHELPQIFNAIFADHIRSTLIEVIAFTAGDGFTDVIIDIDSDFVALANIVILSEHGILDARVFDPSGTEALFDQETITFSNSRKYSIIKILFPEKGEWLLQVLGVTGDQVRVNLIYQYNIHIGIEVSQEEAIGPLFNSKSPVNIYGQILVNGEPIEDDSLYSATKSNAIITDLHDDILFKIPLSVTDNGLVGSFTPKNDEPVVIYIETVASTFAKVSSVVVIQFERIPTPTEPTETPPTPSPGSTPVVAPTPQPPSNPSVWSLFGIYVIAGALILALIGVVVVMILRNRPKFFEGFLEVRLMNENGVYTSVEAPALHTYVGSIDLDRFLTDNMPPKIREELASLSFGVKNLIITPYVSGNTSAIMLENKSGSATRTDSGLPVIKNHLWKPDERIIITGADESSPAKIELTYRIEE